MTVDQVEKHRYWVDEDGRIWERQSYCLEPTVTFALMSSGGAEPAYEKPQRMGGAIGCHLLQDLQPLQHPTFEKLEREMG